MKWFFKTTNPAGLFKWRGPFEDEDEALTAKAAFDENVPTETSEAPFEAEDNYLDACPRRHLTIERVNGGQAAVYDDGTIVELP